MLGDERAPAGDGVDEALGDQDANSLAYGADCQACLAGKVGDRGNQPAVRAISAITQHHLLLTSGQQLAGCYRDV